VAVDRGYPGVPLALAVPGAVDQPALMEFPVLDGLRRGVRSLASGKPSRIVTPAMNPRTK
jgi:hypothetical protein